MVEPEDYGQSKAVKERQRRARHVEGDYVCGFCGKHHSEVAKMIAGKDAAICDECAALVVEILLTDVPEWTARAKAELAEQLAEITPAHPGGEARCEHGRRGDQGGREDLKGPAESPGRGMPPPPSGDGADEGQPLL
jgi:hypothetical protein